MFVCVCVGVFVCVALSGGVYVYNVQCCAVLWCVVVWYGGLHGGRGDSLVINCIAFLFICCVILLRDASRCSSGSRCCSELCCVDWWCIVLFGVASLCVTLHCDLQRGPIYDRVVLQCVMFLVCCLCYVMFFFLLL